MSRLPEYLDPWYEAERGAHFHGVAALEELPRLAGILVEQEGVVSFDLEFFSDAKHRACVRGKVEAVVNLQCQRCLEPVAIAVETTLMLAAVQGCEEAKHLPEEYDPLLVKDGHVRSVELLEDEIILALPQVPMHPDEAGCSVKNAKSGEADAHAKSPGSEPSDNPFQVLAQLKKRTH